MCKKFLSLVLAAAMRNGNVHADVPPLCEERIRFFDSGHQK